MESFYRSSSKRCPTKIGLCEWRAQVFERSDNEGMKTLNLHPAPVRNESKRRRESPILSGERSSPLLRNESQRRRESPILSGERSSPELRSPSEYKVASHDCFLRRKPLSVTDTFEKIPALVGGKDNHFHEAPKPLTLVNPRDIYDPLSIRGSLFLTN